MTPTDRRPRLLVVGTCDFDNFGDLLIMLVTNRYLARQSDLEITCGAPFGWDIDGLLDHDVRPYGQLLAEQQFDAIWTAGGGARGGHGVLEFLFRLSAPDDVYEDFRHRSGNERDHLLKAIVGPGRIPCAHVPSPLEYPRNASAVTVINSLELFPILGADSPLDVSPSHQETIEIISLLRGTTFVSVRDKASSQLLNALGIEHRLAPDVVHALGLIYAGDDVEQSDVAVVQVKSRFLVELGAANVAKAIVESENLRGLRIRLLQAGMLRGDDNVEASEQLLTHIKEAAPDRDVQLLRDRHPLDLVDQIRRARLVIGTSHHLRVIACAYHKSRVSLGIVPTVTRYACYWDPDMPYGVTLPQLDEAVGKALSDSVRDKASERADQLSQLAQANLESLAKHTRNLVSTQSAEDKSARLRRRRAELYASRDDHPNQ